jgi:nucleotidyltransferase/DNA polymerase involved in DNA repair
MNIAKPAVQWLFLDLNAFCASCEQQEAPALRGKPVIVVETLTDSAVAIAASYAAKAFGIKTGTIVREARRLWCRPITGSTPSTTSAFSRPSIPACRSRR